MIRRRAVRCCAIIAAKCSAATAVQTAMASHVVRRGREIPRKQTIRHQAPAAVGNPAVAETPGRSAPQPQGHSICVCKASPLRFGGRQTVTLLTITRCSFAVFHPVKRFSLNKFLSPARRRIPSNRWWTTLLPKAITLGMIAAMVVCPLSGSHGWVGSTRCTDSGVPLAVNPFVVRMSDR